MNRTFAIYTAIMLALFSFLSSYAEGGLLSGEIKLKGEAVSLSGNEAKFDEYGDQRDGGLFGKVTLGYDAENYYLQFRASDMFYDTERYQLDGGMWGKFKYNLYYNEIIHNYTFDAKTFYSGAGRDSLTFSGTYIGAGQPVTTDPATWTNTFDYSVQRRQYGGGFKLEILKPFYLDVSVSREERDGIYPVAASRYTSPQGGFVELPAPVDYVTDTLKAEIGYATKPLSASLAYFYSKFDNDNENLSFRFPSTAAGGVTDPDIFTLPPDNKYYKLAFKGMAKLPFNSSLNVNAGYSHNTSEVDVLTYMLYASSSGASSNAAKKTITGLTDSTFDGEINTTNVDVVLTTRPVSFLDGKIFYKYYDYDNESNEITGTGQGGNGTYTNHLFEYKKNAFGGEVGIKLPAKITVTPYYRYMMTDRKRDDIPETTDNIYGVDVKWAGLDFLTAKVGYERLDRGADYELEFGAGTVGPYGIAFDGAPQKRDTFKASLEIYPLNNLSIGLGYKHKKSDYEETSYGLLEEKSDEFNLNMDYTIGKLVTLSGYFDYEIYNHHQASTPSADTTDTLGWKLEQEDQSYDYGIAADIHIIPNRLTVRAQYDNVRSNGNADLTYLATAFPGSTPAGFYNNDNLDITNWDDYRTESVMVKAIYSASKNLSLAVGYAYEKFKYNDAAIDGYNYYPQSNSFLTGAYSEPSYQANIVFFTLAYKF
jgi:MtrB/PioB family decaheme-associated outer membrane protein